MGALTETEIFDCMSHNLKLAIGHCVDLATNPIKGPTYHKLRTELGLIEGCCRQASAWREDTRWLNIGLLMAKAHKEAGNWLRGYKVNGVRITLASAHSNPLFLMLAENLRACLRLAEQTKNQRTFRVGPLVPRIGQRIMPRMTRGGIILPDMAAMR